MRTEFSAKIKDAAFKKSEGKCGICKQPLQPGKIQYDHILPCALGGKAELANCMTTCTPCHSAKTGKEDVPRIRKADRQRRAHIGAKVEPVKKIENAGFPLKKSKPEPRPSLPPRILFQ